MIALPTPKILPQDADDEQYPSSDGKPMAENTTQYKWIVMLKENLEILFAEDPNVFVAADLLWYPVERHPEISVAPDVLIAFGRPKGYRSSYRQWREENTPLHVVFEILSPGNGFSDLLDKASFYETYGVEECYYYEPFKNKLTLWNRNPEGRWQIHHVDAGENWVSPRMGVRFEMESDTLNIFYPNGERFKTQLELSQERNAIQAERDSIQQALAQEKEQTARLLALLQERGIAVDMPSEK